MKKITTFALIIVVLFSVVLFSACGDKYKKLKMEIVLTDGSAVEELVLIKDVDKPNLSTKRIGVKFSGIDEEDIGQVAVYSVPGELFTTTNANYNGNYYYVDINATKASTGELVVKHLATGRTVSTKLRIEQKSEDLVTRSERYVVAVNGLSEGQTRTHTINAKNLVSLVPSTSTDKIYFKELTNNLPTNVKKIEENIDGEIFVTGFEISYSSSLSTGSIRLVPVTKMQGYEDKEYDEKPVTIYFEKVLSNENVVLDTDEDHKYEFAVGDLRIYDTIHLIANENAAEKDELYNFNNAIFDLKTLELGEISNYLEDYSIVVNKTAKGNNASAIQSSHIGNGRFVVQALAYTDDVVEVEFSLIPKNIVGDVSVISKTIKVKGELRANEIIAKKSNEIIDTNNVVDIYDYVASNTNGHKFNFLTGIKGEEENSGIKLYNDLTLMRIEIAPQILYLNNFNGKYTNIQNVDGSFVDADTTQVGDAVNGYINLANQKKLIRIFKGNSFLNFKYDAESKMFVSETFKNTDNIYIKYVEQEIGGTGVELKLNVISGYEGELNYLKDIPQAKIVLNFEAQKGVKSLDLFASTFYPGAGGGTDNSLVGGEVNPITVGEEGIYINKLSENIIWTDSEPAINTHGYTISILKYKSIKDANDEYLNSDAKFKVEITPKNAQTNPIKLKDVADEINVNVSENNLHIPIVVNENTSVGHYVITFTSGNDFTKSVNVYIYKEFDINDMTLKFGDGELDQYSFKNSYIDGDTKIFTFEKYVADYIVEEGKTLNLSVNIDEEVLSSNIIKNYNYSSGELKHIDADDGSVSAVASSDLVLNNYFNFVKNSDNASKSELRFLNGTFYNGNRYYVSYQVEIETRKFTNILQEDVTSSNKTPTTLTFAIYERIADGKTLKAELVHPIYQVYMYDYLGYHNQQFGKADLSVTMTDENLWNYVQTDDGKLVNWEYEYVNLESWSGPGVTFDEILDKSLSVTFNVLDGKTYYNAVITAKIKQFNTIIPLSWSVLVNKPNLTEELRLTNAEPTFKKLSSNGYWTNKIVEYDLDLREGDEFEISAEHFNSSGEVTHKGITIVVTNAAGTTMYHRVSVDENKIKVEGIQAGIKLIVFATDTLNADVSKFTSGFNNPTSCIKGIERDDKQYMKSYFIINLHLEDGETRETAYSVYDINDFKDMMNETNGKFYRIMNDINVSGLSSSAFNKEFVGNVFGYNEDCTIFGLELNNTNKNLFKTFTGSMENICFETSYNYNSSTQAGNLGIIGELKELSTLKYVKTIVSGEIELNTGSYNFGLLVGESNGNIFYYENIASGKYVGRKCTAISGEITLKGGANVTFGGIAGVNNANIIAENYNESDLTAGATQDITFATSEGQEGVLVNIDIDASGFTGLGSYFGGIVGYNCGKLSNAYVTGTIKAPNVNNVGGAIGYAKFDKPTDDSYKRNSSTNEITTEPDVVNVEHIKSNIVIIGDNNVGGIVGVDEYGVYKHCWYQILPTTSIGLTGYNNVGGIVGYSKHSKLQFCSVFSYKYDYRDADAFGNADEYIASLKNADGSEKSADIIGNNYVAGLVGFVEGSQLQPDTIDVTGTTIIRNSSVNAVIKSNNYVGGIYATKDNEVSGIIYSAYFIGKLTGNYGTNYLDNFNSSANNIVYALNVKADGTGFETEYNKNGTSSFYKTTVPVAIPNWNKYTGINLGYIYVSSGENATENKPIFDLVPSSFNVVTTDDTTMLNKYFYDFSVSEASETDLEILNKEFNQYDLLSLFKFTYAPGGKIAVAVKSSNTNVVDIVFVGRVAKLNVVGAGSATLIFYPVLNPNLVSTIEVNVEETLSNVVVTKDGRTVLTEVNVTKDATKQVQHYSVGQVDATEIDGLGKFYSYKSTSVYGLILEIKWKTGATGSGLISDYITVNGVKDPEEFISNTDTLLKVYIPYGTMLSFTGKLVGGLFDVWVLPCFSNGNALYDADINKVYPSITGSDSGRICDFGLNTCTGASGISLNYNSAIVYPNDVTTLIATISTDIELNYIDIILLINSIYENDKLVIGISKVNVSGIEYIELLKNTYINGVVTSSTNRYNILNAEDINNLKTALAEYISIKEISTRDVNYKQKVTFKLVIDEKYGESNTDNKLKINFKSEYSLFETAEYSILPQRIDKIEAKSYTYTGTDITPSEVLKPYTTGLLVIDIAPINGYFDYLEIDDVTGNEEIVFMQLDDVNGESLFGKDYPSSLGKGIRLVKVDKNNDGVADSTSIYVTMQIDANYTSKLHTLKITAYYQNGTVGEVLRTDYKYIDVKMLPIIKVEHQLPNGETKLYETNSSDTPSPANLFFANGTSSQFRITTLNTTEPLDFSEISISEGTNNFELVNTHGDFYILRNRVIDDADYGKTITIKLKAQAIIGPNVETTTLTLEFKVVKYVIHSVSVTTSNNKGEIFGNIGVPNELEFYFKATDISYYENGTYHDKIYTYESGLSGVDEARISINEILRKLNTEADDYLILNKGLASGYTKPQTAANKNGKYDELTAEDKQKIVLTTNSDGENKLVVYTGYNEKAHLAVDMELKLDEEDYNWDVQQNIESDTLTLSKNYKLNFIKPYSEDDYMLVKNEEDFLAMQSGKQNYYILGNDLVLENYVPIDIDIAEFDGNGRTITIKSFAKFTEENIQAGLFKQIYAGMTVKNVNVVYQSTSYETVYSFGVARVNDDSSNVKNFDVEYADLCNDITINYVSATFGGLTPTNNGVVTNCTVDGEIALRASTVEINKTATESGNYEIAFNIGGLIGTNGQTGYITHSSSGLKIFALANVGGLVYDNQGKVSSSAVEDDALIYSYNPNLEKTILVEIGGFVSMNSGTISMSHASYVFNYNATDKKAGGFMSCKDESAGFVYENSGEIKNCYTEMLKIGDNNHTFCGFVYANTSGIIKNCYTNINQGKDPGTSTHMFAQNGTSNIEDCLEFVQVVTGYVPNSSVELKTISYNETENGEARIKQIFEENGFVFGSNNQAVWSIDGVKLPVLVACEDKVRYTDNRSSSGNMYYGLRNFEYVEKTTKHPDGTTSFEYKVEFREDSYGTKENPFVIYNLANWENRFYNNSTMYYRIVADIEFDILKNPTTSVMVFSGNIQGNDMTLNNIKLYLKEDVEALGVFKTLQTADNFRIENSVKNLNLEIVSGWASKADAFGMLAGKAIGFNLYNITVNAQDVMVGGNAVGGVVGYVGGAFDVDGILTTVSVNSTRELSTYRYNIYAGRNNSLESNLNKVFYAGSAFGVVDGYDGSYYNINNPNERDIEKDRYVVNHVKVEGNPVLIGDTVGGAFGFVGERVIAKNVNINLAGAQFKGYQYSAGIAGENRGVITNSKVVMTGENFVEANYAIGGAVGLNIGGLIKDIYVEADIVRNVNISVGGIIARNVNGVITNVEFNGVVFGNIVGGIMASNYSLNVFKNNAGAGGIIYTDTIDLIVPRNEVVYSGVTNYQSLTLSEKTLDYFIENIHKFYSYKEISTIVGTETETSMTQYKYRAFGLFVAMTDVDHIVETEVFDSKIVKVEYNTTDKKIVLNGTTNSIVDKVINIEPDNSVEKIKYANANDSTYALNPDGSFGVKGMESAATNLVKTLTKNLDYLTPIYITGVKVNNFDSWDKTSFTSDFIVFGAF